MSDIQRYRTSMFRADAMHKCKERNYISEKDHIKAIEAKEKEIESLKAEVERLQMSLYEIEKDKNDRIQQDWDSYTPSPRSMG